ncbi:MAG: PKD domain-containing protein [Bacteroidales bacterium]|nr:PKD domain-containing protein [Bacteroidales bacterium]
MRKKVLLFNKITFIAFILLLGSNIAKSQQLLYYWNFNDNVPPTNANWAQPIPSQIGGAQISYTFTEAFSFAGTTFNGIEGEVNGGSLSPRGGVDNINNGESFTMSIPTTSYENIGLSYATRRTSTGFTTQEVQYTTNGSTWQTKQIIDISGFDNNWLANQVITLDFTGDAGVNNNPNFAIRIIVTGSTSSAGNNRFDNIKITGLQPGAVLPPANLNAEAVSTSQISLDWDLNSNNNDVLLAWSADGVFGNPTGTYSVGAPITGGGTVLYFGSATSINHSGLAAGTTYYYKAWSKSGSDYSTGITASETTFPDPATTTLPYTETFDADLGNCYVYSVSGPTKFWNYATFSGNGFAQSNGFNSGDLEEDWLILPGINLNDYINEVLTFETWWRYGTDDVNNYLKLFYSANYPGTGDPTSATWTELAFIQPAIEQTWTGSGNIDLSGISGSMVYIGLKYRYESGSYRWWEVDNLSVTGIPSGSTATKLSVSDVNNGTSPSVLTPFEVTVTALNDSNMPAAVNADTPVTLSLASGTGALGGALGGVIPQGETSVTLATVTYNIAETGVSISASATGLTSGTSAPFEVLSAANHLAFVNVPAYGQISSPVTPFTVEARRANNTLDLNFTGNITLSKASGPGTITGTLVLPAVAGVVEFSDIEFDQAGTYTLQAASGSLTSATSTALVILGEPQVVAEILPQYIMGNNPGNNRLPFAFRATFSNLIPNAIYKYINQAVINTDEPTSAGAGNAIYVTTSGDFIRSTGTSFTNPDQHYEFTTNASGTFTGWFVTEPTGNARFTPGNQVFMRIRLNNGAGGTSAAHYLTIAESVTVLGLGTENDALQGSGVYGKHFSTGKNFALLYDNIAGTGRPLSASFIENDGTTGGTAYPIFYQNHVDGLEGSWGALIPNQLVNGLRRVEIRDRTSGSIIAGSATVANGIWPYGSNTVNPTTGTTGLLITPWPNFVASAVNVAPGTTVTFTDLTLGSPTAWNWEFIGGTPSSSSLQNPSVIYYNTGEFDVTLEITTEFGTEVISKTEYINVNPLPWPEFSGTPTVVPIGEGVTFTDMSTGDPTSWSWTFEGGTPATFNGQTPPAVTYSTPGQYDVTLVVSNQWGSNDITKTDYITTGFPPVVDFSANTTNIIEGQTVIFSDLTQHDPTTWAWEFEGGIPATSANQNPQVVYNAPGSFSVTLTATNQFGEDMLTKTTYIVVNPVGISNPEVPQLVLWPNPGSGLFNISLPQAGMVVKIYNLTGQMLMQTILNKGIRELNISHLDKGVYIIEGAATDGFIARTKLLLQ